MANVDLQIDQGADWAAQIYWTDGEGNPYQVTGPMRMEIRNEVGGVALTLQTNESSEDVDNPDDQSILFNSESGLIQLYLTAAQTATVGPGSYRYDLFTHYSDTALTGRVRLQKLISGSVLVQGRVTSSI